MSGRWSTAVVHAALVVATTVGLVAVPARASAPAARPDPCAGAPQTAAEYRDAFAALPALGSGYETADGYVPVGLPDGRTAWLMSDTLLTEPGGGPSAAFVHNSIVVQRGRCFTPVLGGTVEDRTDVVPGLFGRWCWPRAGVARGHRLIVFCDVVGPAPGPPGFDFAVAGSAIATFHLPDLTFQRLTPLPFTETAGVPWGNGAVRIGDTVYVYGSTTSGHAYVARTRFDTVTRGPWNFWTGKQWGPRGAAAPMQFGHGTPGGQPFVAVDGQGLRAVAFLHDVLSPRIEAWTATRPQGPWRWNGTAALAETVGTQFAYDARIAHLGPVGWTVVYNVNDPEGTAPDLERYGGRFMAAPRPVHGASN